jgi:AraC-like DNA-binding protein
VSTAGHAYRSVRYGVETLLSGLVLERHRHTHGYATVVLGGSFVEASFSGRARAQPGDVLLHGRFDCHANWGERRCGALQILRLPWWDDDLEGHFRVDDPDHLARLAEHDPVEATSVLHRSLEAAKVPAFDWPERLARVLKDGPTPSLGAWARAEGLAPETVSRGFRKAFGVSPKSFRLEARSRRAWGLVMGSDLPLTTIAYELAFADLAHMSRSVSLLTGSSPSIWRRSRLTSSRLPAKPATW